MSEKTAWEVIHSFPADFLIDSTQRNERIEICNNCNQLSAIKLCKMCGCMMPVKTWLRAAKCPAGRW